MAVILLGEFIPPTPSDNPAHSEAPLKDMTFFDDEVNVGKNINRQL